MFKCYKKSSDRKRQNKKNKILLIFAFLFTEKSSMGSFQPLKTTKAVRFVSSSST